MYQKGFSTVAVSLVIIGIFVVVLGGYFVFSPNALIMRDATPIQEDHIQVGLLHVSFSDDVTKDEAMAFLNNVGLSVNEERLGSTIQLREFSYPSSRFQAIFADLEKTSVVETCRIIRESPEGGFVNAECHFRSNVSRSEAVKVLAAYPEVGLATENPAPPIIYWKDFFFLDRIIIPVPSGKEREWEAKLKTYSEIASASVVPSTDLPAFPYQ